MTPTLRVPLHPKQFLAIKAPANEILFGGAAGGGKSYLMRAMAIMLCMAIPGLFCVLFRRLWPDLRRNHMEGPSSFHVMLAPLVESGHCVITAQKIVFWNGSTIELSHCQYEKDWIRWQGSEIHVALFDELTHFTESIYRNIRGRVRLGGLKVPKKWQHKLPLVLSSANPGGVGHVWVKRTFVNAGPFRVHTAPEEEGGMRRVYIPSKLADNPTMKTNDPLYEKRLLGLGDKTMVRAMLDGDWNIVSGSMFGDIWRESRHIVTPFEIPIDWQVWRGADDGFASPASVHWLTEDPHDKTIYVIEELYKPRLRSEVLAEKIIERDRRLMRMQPDGRIVPNPVPLSGLMDSSAWDDKGHDVNKDAIRGDVLNRMGCNFRPVKKWSGSRVARCRQLHRLLEPNPRNPDGMPGIRFFRNCIHAIETIPVLPRDPHNPEDVDTDAEDHAYDSITYGLLWKERGLHRVRMGGV